MIIHIDGKACVCEKGEYLLHVAAQNGIFIPRFCHHPGLPGQACCRVCVVEVETEAGGARQVVSSCVYPVEQEMQVYTNSDKIKKLRRMVLSLLSARAPDSGRAAALLKSAGGSLPERFTRLAGEKCIMCGLCAKACESIGTAAISTTGRGTDKKISTPFALPSDACVGCASCAAVCPTEAIAYTEDGGTRTIWGRRFQLKYCETCGEPLGTEEELAHAASQAGIEPAKLCPACRKKAIAGAMSKPYSHG